MEELVVKKDFTDIYTRDSPYEYLKEMKRLQYRIPDLTKPLYLSLTEQLYNKLQRPITILDLGSSYGINSALIKYNLTMSELDDFFLKENNPDKKQSREFFKDLPIDDALNFYQVDISKPALEFSEEMGLCKKGICKNLETSDLERLKELPKFDIVIATGCIGYIGYKAFSNLFEIIKKQEDDSSQNKTQNNTPIFAFTVLRIFDMKKIQKTFDYYGYSLVKSDLKPIRQRRFSDSDERSQTLSLLHSKGIDTKDYEDDGYFYANFYVAGPKRLENQLISMSRNMEKHSRSN
jgi:hypothetical protein